LLVKGLKPFGKTGEHMIKGDEVKTISFSKIPEAELQSAFRLLKLFFRHSGRPG